MSAMRLVPAAGDALERILDESHRIWSDRLTRQAYGRYNAAQMLTPWGARCLRRLALVDDSGSVLSTAKRYYLQAHLDGHQILVAGIAAVFTPAAHRGRGHARTIVDEILSTARSDGADLALLFSEIDPDYYAAMGFAAIPRRELVLRPVERSGAPAVLVRVADDRDIPAISALATAMAAPYRFALEQPEDFVRFGLSKKRLLAGFLSPGLLNVESFIVEEGASASAFAILTATSDDVVLEFCGDRDPSGARVGALLQVLRARTPAERPLALSAFLPPAWLPPQLEVESVSESREVMMVKPLRDGVLQRPLVDSDVLYWHGDLI